MRYCVQWESLYALLRTRSVHHPPATNHHPPPTHHPPPATSQNYPLPKSGPVGVGVGGGGVVPVARKENRLCRQTRIVQNSKLNCANIVCDYCCDILIIHSDESHSIPVTYQCNRTSTHSAAKPRPLPPCPVSAVHFSFTLRTTLLGGNAFEVSGRKGAKKSMVSAGNEPGIANQRLLQYVT